MRNRPFAERDLVPPWAEGRTHDSIAAPRTVGFGAWEYVKPRSWLHLAPKPNLSCIRRPPDGSPAQRFPVQSEHGDLDNVGA